MSLNSPNLIEGPPNPIGFAFSLNPNSLKTRAPKTGFNSQNNLSVLKLSTIRSGQFQVGICTKIEHTQKRSILDCIFTQNFSSESSAQLSTESSTEIQYSAGFQISDRNKY